MLTPAEKHVVHLTVQLTNAFCRLPEEHSQDKDEFVLLVHRIQDMVLSRPGRREYNGVEEADVDG